MRPILSTPAAQRARGAAAVLVPLFTVLAWLLALAGAGWAIIVGLGSAMRTVPHLDTSDALAAVPLPLAAAVLAAACLWLAAPRPARPPGSNDRRPARGRPWLAAGLPLGLAVFALLYLAVSYYSQPGGAP